MIIISVVVFAIPVMHAACCAACIVTLIVKHASITILAYTKNKYSIQTKIMNIIL